MGVGPQEDPPGDQVATAQERPPANRPFESLRIRIRLLLLSGLFFAPLLFPRRPRLKHIVKSELGPLPRKSPTRQQQQRRLAAARYDVHALFPERGHLRSSTPRPPPC